MFRRIIAASLLIVLSCTSDQSATENKCAAEGDVPTEACWAADPTINFNPALDPDLEFAGTGGGAASTSARRKAAFKAAVDAWNAALMAAGATLKITIGEGGWAIQQNMKVCNGNAPLQPGLPWLVRDVYDYKD